MYISLAYPSLVFSSGRVFDFDRKGRGDSSFIHLYKVGVLENNVIVMLVMIRRWWEGQKV